MMNQLQIGEGSPISLRDALELTDSFVASTAIDLKSYDSVALMFEVSATDAAHTMTIAYDWSNDLVDASASVTNWYNETIETAGTASGGALASASSIRTTTVDLAVAQNPIMRLRRMGRWFRVRVKGDTSTTATIAITAMRMCNQN
jgi:hypothetical protein